MKRRTASLLMAGFVLTIAATARAGEPEGCQPEPASQWAPAGWVCPPRYGVGTASTWNGSGAATNSCSYVVRESTGCQTLAIRSLDTGIVVIATPVDWCMCWVGVTGPNGETERLVDLSPDLVAALGLPGPGLYDVEVQPFRENQSSAVLPDTASEAP